MPSTHSFLLRVHIHNEVQNECFIAYPVPEEFMYAVSRYAKLKDLEVGKW